jgi:ribosomal protein S18 acetylase RimI-like enzyme
MMIRNAKQSDAPHIAAYLLLAMEDIVYDFIGTEDRNKALNFLHYFTARKGNQYSYQHCRVAEIEGKVQAAVSVYDGAMLDILREPVAEYIREVLEKDFNPGAETAAGEYYIDSLGVDPVLQGKGIGAAMLQHLIEEYAHQQGHTLGLLVDKDNPAAKRLYLRLGFEPVGEKQFAGKTLEHLQYTPRK